ncbi:MAG: 1,6-anhydro-N-acetylmuramyl-L-alanine amidase AmpD [Alteromonadaceae bacterium]|nr:MAG: 1,6-anhydro-N-acetylmuramyl-L-alanine amidase AmpD [Alteromonadaceae bacterium]
MINDGWLAQVNRSHSPNYNERPPGLEIDLLVIHNISLPPGQFGGGYVQSFFANTLDSSIHPFFSEIQNLEVSSHCLIERDGSVFQFVPFDKRAWHAGRSCHQGRENCNDFSVGIELEGTDTDAYTVDQYLQLALVTRSLMSAYPEITAERIVGHSDIAPGRKTDPGESFDWERFRTALKSSQL